MKCASTDLECQEVLAEKFKIACGLRYKSVISRVLGNLIMYTMFKVHIILMKRPNCLGLKLLIQAFQSASDINTSSLKFYWNAM